MTLHPMVRRIAWPACLLANIGPLVCVARWWPHLLPQVASAVTIALLLALIVAERLDPHRVDWRVAGDPEIARDVGHVIAYSMAVTAARLLVLGGLAAALARAGATDVLVAWPSHAPLIAQILLVIVLGDLLEYAFHRASHALPWLWRLHALHHTPVRLHVVKGARHHLLYAFGRGIAVWVPLLVLGAPAELIYWQFIAITIVGLPAHANVSFRIPALVHRLLVTPEFHRIHHAADSHLGCTNYGVVFPFWDLLFRSHSDPLRVRVAQAGIPDDPIPRRFVGELMSPFTYAKLEARRHARTAARP